MALSSLLSTKFPLPGVASAAGKPGKFQRIAISQEWQKRAGLGYVRLEQGPSGVGTQARVWAYDQRVLDEVHAFGHLHGNKDLEAFKEALKILSPNPPIHHSHDSTVRVWELVMPMEMAEKLANLELAFYLKNNHHVRPSLCRRHGDPENASLFLTGCGAGLAAAAPIYITACVVQDHNVNPETTGKTVLMDSQGQELQLADVNLPILVLPASRYQILEKSPFSGKKYVRLVDPLNPSHPLTAIACTKVLGTAGLRNEKRKDRPDQMPSPTHRRPAQTQKLDHELLDGIDSLKISGEQFIEAAADGAKDSIDVPQTMYNFAGELVPVLPTPMSTLRNERADVIAKLRLDNGQENKEAAGPPFMLVTVREVGWRGAEVEPGQGSLRPAKVVACRIKAESTEVKITGNFGPSVSRKLATLMKMAMLWEPSLWSRYRVAANPMAKGEAWQLIVAAPPTRFDELSGSSCMLPYAVSVALAMLDLQLSVDVAYTGDLGLDLKVYGVGDLQAKILGIVRTGRVKVVVVPAANIDAQGHLVSHDADGIKAVQLRGDALTKLTIVSVETLTEAVDLAVLLARGDVQLSPAAAALRVENAKLVCVRGLSQEHGQSTRLLLHHAQSLGVDARFELSEMMQAVASDIEHDDAARLVSAMTLMTKKLGASELLSRVITNITCGGIRGSVELTGALGVAALATLLQIDGGMLEGVAVNGILEADGSLAAHDTVHVLGERLGDWLTKAGVNLLVVPPTQKVGFPVDQAPEAQLAVLQASNVAEALEAVCRHRHMSLSELLKQNVGQTKEAGEEEAKDATESGPPEQPESGGNGDESGVNQPSPAQLLDLQRVQNFYTGTAVLQDYTAVPLTPNTYKPQRDVYLKQVQQIIREQLRYESFEKAIEWDLDENHFVTIITIENRTNEVVGFARSRWYEYEEKRGEDLYYVWTLDIEGYANRKDHKGKKLGKYMVMKTMQLANRGVEGCLVSAKVREGDALAASRGCLKSAALAMGREFVCVPDGESGLVYVADAEKEGPGGANHQYIAHLSPAERRKMREADDKLGRLKLYKMACKQSE